MVDGTGADRVVVAPDHLEQARLGDHLVRMGDQVVEQGERLRGEGDLASGQPDPARRAVHLEFAGGEDGGAGQGGSAGAGSAQYRAHPGDQFAGVERLVEVVVGALVERPGPLGGLPHRGEQHHRDGVAVAAQPAQGFASVQAGHHHVEHHDVDSAGSHRGERPVAVLGDGHRETVALQDRAQAGGDARVVVDQQQRGVLSRHSRPPARRRTRQNWSRCREPPWSGS